MKFVREAFFLDSLDGYFSLNSSRESAALRDGIKELIRLYSANEKIEKLASNLDSLLREDFPNPLNVEVADDYFLGLSFLSLYRLLHLNKDNDKTVGAILGNLQQDRLIDFIFNNGMSLNLNLRIYYVSPCVFLNNAVSTPENGSAILVEYFRQFYAGIKSSSWHDSHINNAKDFFGYWSFESAILTKLLKIDDTDYANHMFYPRDLLNKPLLPTWCDGTIGRYARRKYQELKRTARAASSINELKEEELEEILANLTKQFVFREVFDPSLMEKVMNIATDFEKLEGNTDKDPETFRNFLFDMFTDIKNLSGIFDFDSLKSEFAAWSIELEESLVKRFPELKGEKDVHTILKKFNLDSSVLSEYGTVQLDKIQDVANRYLEIHEKYTAEEDEFWDQVDVLLLEMDVTEDHYFEQFSERLSSELKSDLKKENYLSKFQFSVDDILKKK